MMPTFFLYTSWVSLYNIYYIPFESHYKVWSDCIISDYHTRHTKIHLYKRTKLCDVSQYLIKFINVSSLAILPPKKFTQITVQHMPMCTTVFFVAPFCFSPTPFNVLCVRFGVWVGEIVGVIDSLVSEATIGTNLEPTISWFLYNSIYTIL